MERSYAAWERFNVDKELEEVDVQAEREEKEKEKSRQQQRQRLAEAKAAESSQRSAEAAAAHAKVAALKAKRKRKQKTTVGTKNNKEADVQQLEERSACMQRKHELLTTILDNRNRGEKALEKGGDLQEARGLLQQAIEAADELKDLLPRLKKFASPENQEQQDDREMDMNCPTKSNEDLHNSHSCCKDKSTPSKDKASVANDIGSMLQTMYKDLYLGLSRCELQGERLADATDALKQVLLRHGHCVEAWKLRGIAFERMDATLLALVHFNRAVELDSNEEYSASALERCTNKITKASSDPNPSDTGHTRHGSGIVQVTSVSLQDSLVKIQELMKQGNVLMKEAFYLYAIEKLNLSVQYLNQTLHTHAAGEYLTKQLHKMIKMCQMNIADAKAVLSGKI